MSKKLILVVVLIVVVVGYFVNSTSGDKVKEADLRTAIGKYVISEANEKGYKVSVKDEHMIVTTKHGDFNVNYDLQGNPIFTYEFEVKKGMSYADYEKYNENLMLPRLGYIAVANMQGVTIENAHLYFSMSFFSEALKNSSVADVIVVEDEDADFYKNFSDEIILESEFGDKAIDYAKKVHRKKITMGDSNEYNTYSLVIERKDINDTTCKIVSTLTVNLEGDFSKLN